MAGAREAVPTDLSLLLFNVTHGSGFSRRSTLDSTEENTSTPRRRGTGIISDQTAGITAVLRSDEVKSAQNLFVLTSEQGQTGAKLDMLKDLLGIEQSDAFLCNHTVGIFQKRTETTFLGKNERAAFVKVEVSVIGGNVHVLLVSYHGKHKGMTILQKKKDFGQLISDSDGMKRCLGCKAVIIGGDFNLPLKEAKEATTDQQALTGVHYSAPGADLDPLTDYVVFWSDADVQLEVAEGFPKVLRWTDEPLGKIPPTYRNVVSIDRPDPRNYPNMEPFDHPRLLYKFEVSRPISRPISRPMVDTEVEDVSAGVEGIEITE